MILLIDHLQNENSQAWLKTLLTESELLYLELCLERKEGIFGVIFFYPSTASFPHSVLQSLLQGQKSLGWQSYWILQMCVDTKKKRSQKRFYWSIQRSSGDVGSGWILPLHCFKFCYRLPTTEYCPFKNYLSSPVVNLTNKFVWIKDHTLLS